MKYFVEFVVSSLVTYAEEVDVQEVDQEGTTTYYVRLNPSDIGRVIGKHGKTIGAIRSLVQAAASRDGRRVQLEVVEDPAA
jgi:predicted RNA-binding protein YlqC (UPF0109 family)